MARSIGAVAWETNDIVNGWPTPNAKPAIATMIAKLITFGANAIAMQEMTEIELLTTKIRAVEYRLLSLPRDRRESIDAPARIAMIAPIENEEKDFSVP